MLPAQQDLKKNLLESQRNEANQTPRQHERSLRHGSPDLLASSKLAKLVTKTAIIKVESEKIDREVYVEATTWNKIKLFLANVYEVNLICLGLALSVYQDDLIAFLYQLPMLVLLYYAMRDMGKYIRKQRNIVLAVIVANIIAWIAKYVLMIELEPTLGQASDKMKIDLDTFGFDWHTHDDGTVGFKYYDTLEFESLSFIVNILLLIYYRGQIKRELKEGKFHYVHHSEWLGMHDLLYRMFFVVIVADTFFSQTLIQMAVLGLMLTLFILWAVNYNRRKFEVAMKYSAVWIRRVYTFQLCMVALSQIPYIIDQLKGEKELYDWLFCSGLILNEIPAYAAVTHILLICWILGFGQLFEATQANHTYYHDNLGLYQHHNLTEALMKNAESSIRGRRQQEEKGFASKIDYQKYMNTYKPYLCLWGARIFAIIMCYAYHGWPALITLTWVLASFMVPVYPFVQFTIFVFLPYQLFGVGFQYFINIPGLFYVRTGFKQVTLLRPSLYKTYGRIFNFPAIETGGMITFAIFLLALIKWRNELKIQRDEFRIGLFSRLTDFRSNFLFQLFYYVLKRVHILLLSLIFVFGMREINVYYIGLMYFFVVYTSSLATYRKSGRILVLYAGFFIWFQYLWSLLQVKYKFDKRSDIYKLFTMITLQNYKEEDNVQDGIEKLQDFLEYQIPVAQWVILMLQVMMVTVNNFFSQDKPYKQKSIENSQVTKEYASISEYYEEKCDFVLRKKFPGSARFLIRLQMIFSEMMIITILIIQGFIVVSQSPNLMFWGFLIFSFTLQTAVVSANENDPKVLRRCATQSKMLKLYSSFVLIAQIAYHFIQDKNFLKQYGFDKILNDLLGPAQSYMSIIGFENYSENNTKSMFEIFVSQILFYITACILEDYFVQQLERVEQTKAEEEKMKQEGYEAIGEPVQGDGSGVQSEGFQFPQSNSAYATGRKTLQAARTSVRLGKTALDVNNANEEDHEFFKQDDKERILYNFERARFSIPYMIYQRMGLWRFIDSICMNFYIVQATVTIVLCTNWQISLFMSFYLICNVILCIRAARDLHSNGQNMKNSDLKEITVDQAHTMNKDYMYYASRTLLKVRVRQWTYQYWLLIISMIVMYPTPIMTKYELRTGNLQDPTQLGTNKTHWIFWLFWSGLYTSPAQVENFMSHAPLYAMILLLIFEKQAQRWQENRYGCTLDKVRDFKILEEQLRLVNKGESPKQLNEFSKIPPVMLRREDDNENGPFTQYVTIMEAKQECERIKSLYREQTPQVKEKRLKNIIQLGLKRKYTIKLRSAMKVFMEQLSLLLLLFSCINKSNLISVLYLALLLTFLLIKNKTTGMLIMSYTFGLTLVLEYLLTLTNLTSMSNPMPFPAPFANGYPAYNSHEDQYVQEFVFPWFVNVDFLRNNLEWSHFFSIDIQSAQVNDIWFDFANLVLLTIYFFSYGNPINALNIKVSFSSTVSIEDCLNRYAKMQMKKKYYIKKGKKEDEIDYDDVEKEEDQRNYFPKKGDEPKKPCKLQDLDQSFSSEKAADNSQEHFLGATYYLAELKKELFIYFFVRKSRYFIFIGLQIFTLIMTFLLAILCRSFMSLGYMIACVPLILQITDFFHLEKLQQEGKRWKHPYFICGPLMIFSFVDIAIQVFCQAPIYHGNYFLRQLGFDKVYDINKQVTLGDLMYPPLDENGQVQHLTFLSLADNGEALFFLVLKSINLFHIFLQSRIYESESFWEFIRIDLRRLINLANSYKKLAVTYRYNNWKLQKIVTLQQRKRKMYESVAELRVKMNHWQKAQRSLISGDLVKNIRQPLLTKIEETDEEHKETKEQINTTTQQQTKPNEALFVGGSDIMDKLMKKVQNKKQLIGDQLKMGLLKEFLDSDEDYLDKVKELKKQRTKLGRCSSFYLWLKQKHINQITFIDDLEEAVTIRNEMEKGKRRIKSDLEKVMMQDINLFFHLNKKKTTKAYHMRTKNKLAKDTTEELELKNMKKTQEFLKFGNLFFSVIGAIMEAVFTNMSTFAYIAMIYSQMYNAGFISIAFPFAVFGYALLEECRPSKQFWTAIIYYTLAIIFLKFIINLNVINDQKDFMDAYLSVQQWLLFGLWRVEGILNLFFYVLPEIIILVTVIGQIYYENLIGLYEKREIEVEDIGKARERFLNSFTEVDKEKQIALRKEKAKMKLLETEESDDDDVTRFIGANNFDKFIIQLGKELKQDTYPYMRNWSREEFKRPEGWKYAEDEVYELQLIKDKLRSKEAEDITLAKILDQRVELKRDVKMYTNPEYDRRNSQIDDSDLLRTTGKELKKARKEKENQGVINTYFKKVPYFRRLFPKIKEQKPGIDFYAKITLVQFVICIYLIQYYTEMDARGTQNLENSNLFSFYMVIVLFIQVFVMILERYISRTNIMVNLKKAGSKKQKVETDDNLIQNMTTFSDTLRSITMHLQQQKTSETVLFDKQQQGISQATQDILQIELQHTRMTAQQVTKFVIQWILLILYHALVFWIFPLSSNDAIYGTPYCDTDSSQYQKYGCFSFPHNTYLVCFYMIFCLYFSLSALQIRYGLPDFKEPSSLTTTIALWPCIGYRIFYSLPFLLELKVILDWCWSKTSLDLWQWLELAEIDSELYFFRNGNKGYYERKLGEKIYRFEKCLCGCFCLGAILFFLVGPFLMFSNLRYIAADNLVQDALIDFSIKIEDLPQMTTYEFPIFMSDSPLTLHTMDEGEFISRGYHKLPETKFFEPNQVQIIAMKNASDTEWPVSGDYRNQLEYYLGKAVDYTPGVLVTLEFAYSFQRPGPVEAPQASGSKNRTLDSSQSDDYRILSELYDAMSMRCKDGDTSTSQIKIRDFIPYQLRLGEKKNVIDLPLEKENVTLSYSCENYWAFNVNEEGLVLITFSDLISGDFFSATSIMAFYLGVAFTVGSLLRSIVVYKADRIFICDIPDPEPVRNLIRCIYLQRLEQNLRKEEELFFILMELLRSPEMLKAICGSSLRAPLVSRDQAANRA